MKSFTLTGELSQVFPEWPELGPLIDGQNVAAKITETFGFDPPEDLTVTLSVHTNNSAVLHKDRNLHASGRVEVRKGSKGYSEVTDWTLDVIQVGNLNLIDQLRHYDYIDMIVTLRVDDGAQHDYSKLKSTHSGSLADNLGRRR